jgi:hypothetical protein
VGRKQLVGEMFDRFFRACKIEKQVFLMRRRSLP